MSATYYVNEPHPTVPVNTYTHSGRGGAGNTFKVSTATTSPSGVPSKASGPSSASSKGRFYSGRGGAGNSHAASERVAMTFDSEYSDASRHANAAVGHVGRGGAGNFFDKTSSSTTSSGSRRDSSSTSGSEKSGFWARLSTSSRH